MTEPHDPQQGSPPASSSPKPQQASEKQARAERVAAALRANLHKRKQQMRARADQATPAAHTAESAESE